MNGDDHFIHRQPETKKVDRDNPFLHFCRPMLNKVLLQARFTEDPELRKTAKGTSVCNIRLASNQRFKDADGNVQERVLFVDGTAWGRLGEVISEHFSKGREILVEGELIYDPYETKEGEKRQKHLIRVDGFHFVGSKPESDEAETAGVASGAKN